MVLFHLTVLAFVFIQLLSPVKSSSTSPLDVHVQGIVTEFVSPVPAVVLDIQRVPENVIEGARQKRLLGVTVQFVSSMILSLSDISSSVQAICRYVLDNVQKGIADALCALGTHCDAPAPVCSSEPPLVRVYPQSSPVQSSPPLVASTPSPSEPLAGKIRRNNPKDLFSGRISSKSPLVSYFHTLGLNTCEFSVFGFHQRQASNELPPNVRGGPAPNTCTLPELDRCGVAIAATAESLGLLYGMITRLSWPSTRSLGDNITKKYYDDIIATTVLASPWGQIFETPTIQRISTPNGSINKHHPRYYEEFCNPLTHIASEGTSKSIVIKAIIDNTDTSIGAAHIRAPNARATTEPPIDTFAEISSTTATKSEHKPLGVDSTSIADSIVPKSVSDVAPPGNLLCGCQRLH
ncbi:hypothetical protein FRC12_013521 [Ceratobasidium sp. 428]|nr:hypothetical protein FRC12_013521 [Ceratobasidium sp. 428]